VPVEAMASGRPVIAYGRGGAIETVAGDLSGILFAEQTVADISSAVRNLSRLDMDSRKIVAHARQFGRDQFFRKMHRHIASLLAQRRNIPSSSDVQLEPEDMASPVS